MHINYLTSNKKRGLISLIWGILMTTVFSLNYCLPNLGEHDFYKAEQTSLGQLFARLGYIIDGYGLIYSILALALAVFCFYSWNKFITYNCTFSLPLAILSILFGIVNVASYCVYYLDQLVMLYYPAWLLGSILLTLGWASFFYLVAQWFLIGTKHLPVAKAYTPSTKFKFVEEHFFLCASILIFLCWLPWIFAFYPGSMENDVYRQLQSYYSLNGWVPNSHDPWFATTILGKCFDIGKKLGSENFGIFLFVFLRDIVLACIYGKCVDLIRKAGFRKAIYYAVLLFYAVVPMWGSYAKHAFKDTLSAGLFCLFIMQLILVIQKLQSRALHRRDCFYLSVTSMFAALFRNNLIYAILPAIILIAIYLFKNKAGWQKLLLLFSCLILYFGYNQYIEKIQQVTPSSPNEACSLLFQQTARVVRDHGDELTDEDKAIIRAILDYDNLAANYDRNISDSVKASAQLPNASSKEKTAYFKWWFANLFKYPASYFEAAIAQSSGYYAFVPNQPEHAGNWNCGMTYFNWLGGDGSQGSEFFSCHYHESTKILRDILADWADIWDHIPLLSMTDNCAFYTWTIILIAYALLQKKKKAACIPIVALLLLILTCVASPVNDCFRYYVPVAAAFPLLLLFYPMVRNRSIG